MRNCCQKLARTAVPHHRAVCSTAADRTRQGRIVSPFHPDCVRRTCRIRRILGFWNSIYWLPKRTLLERFFFFALTWSWDANPRHCNSVLPFTTTTTQPHPLVKPNTPKVIHNKLKDTAMDIIIHPLASTRLYLSSQPLRESLHPRIPPQSPWEQIKETNPCSLVQLHSLRRQHVQVHLRGIHLHERHSVEVPSDEHSLVQV